MAYRLRNGAEFLHIPKTGGSWVISILESNNLILKKLSHEHADYDCNLFQPNLSMSYHKHFLYSMEFFRQRLFRKGEPYQPPPFRFCFVRNPISWYESWWKYMKGEDWNHWGKINSKRYWHPNSILNGLGSDDFNEFVWNVLKKRPGYVSELYFSYTKPGISFIGKKENLVSDFLKVISILDLRISRDQLLKSEAVNVSKTASSMVDWDPKLKEMVRKIELPALIHFNYLSEKERIDLGINKYISPNDALAKT
ncbi:MAG: sulfotransferase family 2 domain-containing protein [Cyclobacteriaceae bacterium]